MRVANADKTVVSVRGLTKVYPPARSTRSKASASLPVRALTDVSFDVGRAEILGVIGESGCGKTTLARTMLRLIEATAGEVWFQGQDLLSVSPEGLRQNVRPHLRMMFQHPEAVLNPGTTIRAALERAIEIHAGNHGRADDGETVEGLLDQVGLPPTTADKYPDELSGGEKRRVGLCRALATRPELVVADEPLSGLDVLLQERILRLLLTVQSTHKFSLIIISHDLERIFQVCSRAIVMFKGRIVEDLSAEQVMREERLGQTAFPLIHPYSRQLLESRIATLARTKGLQSQDSTSDQSALEERSTKSGESNLTSTGPKPEVIGCPVQDICGLFFRKGRPEACCANQPALSSAGPNHRVACHFAEELGSE